MQSNVPLSDLPVWMLALLGVLATVQIGVEIYALVKLFQTPDERLALGKKWPWVLIIVFVNLVGAVVFLAAGRKPVAAVDPLGVNADASPVADRAERAVDVLYGGDAK